MMGGADGPGGSLSFVISGESGAGKTETTKHIMSFFTTPEDGTTTARDPTAAVIMAANPILESFGCAMTVRNNNSSRYGRLVHIYMDVLNRDGTPVPKGLGAKITSYLLEKPDSEKDGEAKESEVEDEKSGSEKDGLE